MNVGNFPAAKRILEHFHAMDGQNFLFRSIIGIYGLAGDVQ